MTTTQDDSTYHQFLARKSHSPTLHGFAPLWMPEFLFDFQQALVDWAIRKGRAAIWADCGLGKTVCELVWAENIVRHTNRPVLILTPLSVSQQTVHEAEKFGIETQRSRDGAFQAQIVITNYERLHLFDYARFAGVVCDECFPENTPIEVLNNDNSLGLKSIQDIRPGDRIVNANGVDHVTDIYKRPINRAIRVGIAGRQSLICSENHPFFTLHGWRSAHDLQPGDLLMETTTAMRLVRGDFFPEICRDEDATVLRDILLSEMAHESSGQCRETSYSGSRGQTRLEDTGLVCVERSESPSTERPSAIAQFYGRPQGTRETFPYLEGYATQTSCARREWAWLDRPSTDDAGSVVRGMESGIPCITQATAPRLSHALQDRLSIANTQDRHRSGWTLASESKGTRQEKRDDTGFLRVDSVEILEQGHPDLERYRDASGKLYFYDLSATRHPSYSVKGCLVHNSSIMKNFDGARKSAITEFMKKVPYRLLCTATPSPNDYVELGTSSECLGEMGYMDMLGMFFKNDQDNLHPVFRGAPWRFKRHAERTFWRWVCSWARACRKPSDLGFDDRAFVLPHLLTKEHVVPSARLDGYLFAIPAHGLHEQRQERRETIQSRCELATRLTTEHAQSIAWCHLNAEGDLLERLIPGAVQVSGADPDERKEEVFTAFCAGEVRTMVTKPSLAAWGLNFQHCAHMTFFPSHSFEQIYQAIRRCWRFGQTQPVTVDMVLSEAEQGVLQNLQRKSEACDRMFATLVQEMHRALTLETQPLPTTPVTLPSWL